MMVCASKCGLVLCVTILLLPRPVYPQSLLVLNRGDDRAEWLDLATGLQISAVRVGRDPHELALTPDGGTAYVTSYGSNLVYVLDTATRTMRTRFTLEGYTRLHGVWTGRREPLVWVTAESGRAVLELNAVTGEILRVWDTGQAMSHMIAGSADDALLYVANVESGSVSIIDRQNGTVTPVPTGAGAEGIDISPDGQEVWVSNNQDNSISILDAGGIVITSFPSHARFPVKLRFTPDGTQVWVSNNASGTVTMFDVVTRELIATVPVGPRPLGLAFSPDGESGFVTLAGAGEVVEICVADQEIVGRLRTGNGPDGLVWLPGGR